MDIILNAAHAHRSVYRYDTMKNKSPYLYTHKTGALLVSYYAMTNKVSIKTKFFKKHKYNLYYL